MDKRKYALMLFETELSLGLSSKPGSWINTQTTYYNNGLEALYHYTKAKATSAQLLDAYTDDDLNEKVEQMKQNYKNENWLNENIYPNL